MTATIHAREQRLTELESQNAEYRFQYWRSKGLSNPSANVLAEAGIGTEAKLHREICQLADAECLVRDYAYDPRQSLADEIWEHRQDENFPHWLDSLDESCQPDPMHINVPDENWPEVHPSRRETEWARKQKRNERARLFYEAAEQLIDIASKPSGPRPAETSDDFPIDDVLYWRVSLRPSDCFPPIDHTRKPPKPVQKALNNGSDRYRWGNSFVYFRNMKAAYAFRDSVRWIQ